MPIPTEAPKDPSEWCERAETAVRELEYLATIKAVSPWLNVQNSSVGWRWAENPPPTHDSHGNPVQNADGDVSQGCVKRLTASSVEIVYLASVAAFVRRYPNFAKDPDDEKDHTRQGLRNRAQQNVATAWDKGQIAKLSDFVRACGRVIAGLATVDPHILDLAYERPATEE